MKKQGKKKKYFWTVVEMGPMEVIDDFMRLKMADNLGTEMFRVEFFWMLLPANHKSLQDFDSAKFGSVGLGF